MVSTTASDEQLIGTTWYPLLSGHPDVFIDSCLCEKNPHPHLACGIGSSKRIPLFHKWPCVYGMCEECGINKIHQLDECDILKNKTSEINLLEWKNVPRQGGKKEW